MRMVKKTMHTPKMMVMKVRNVECLELTDYDPKTIPSNAATILNGTNTGCVLAGTHDTNDVYVIRGERGILLCPHTILLMV